MPDVCDSTPAPCSLTAWIFLKLCKGREAQQLGRAYDGLGVHQGGVAQVVQAVLVEDGGACKVRTTEVGWS